MNELSNDNYDSDRFSSLFKSKPAKKKLTTDQKWQAINLEKFKNGELLTIEELDELSAAGFLDKTCFGDSAEYELANVMPEFGGMVKGQSLDQQW